MVSQPGVRGNQTREAVMPSSERISEVVIPGRLCEIVLGVACVKRSSSLPECNTYCACTDYVQGL